MKETIIDTGNGAKDSAMNMADSAMGTGMDIFDTIMSTLGGFMGYVKPALVALAILIIGGWIVNKVMKLLKMALEKAKVDAMVEKTGLTGELAGMGINVTPSGLITGVIGIVCKFVLWMAAINALGIQALTDLMQEILTFMPNIIVAIVLLFAGITIAKIVKELIEKSASSLSVSADTAAMFGKIAKIAILTLTGMAVLTQLHIAEDLIQTLFSGLIAALSIGAGLAFGLGGQDRAKEIINGLGK